MAKVISESEKEKIKRKHELEMIWLDFYKNRHDLSVEQWREYELVIYEYLRLIS